MCILNNCNAYAERCVSDTIYIVLNYGQYTNGLSKIVHNHQLSIINDYEYKKYYSCLIKYFISDLAKIICDYYKNLMFFSVYFSIIIMNKDG